MPEESNREIRIFKEETELVVYAAEMILDLALQAVQKRGICHLVLSGGGTPLPVYKRFCLPMYVERFPWEKTHFYWGDERLVAADDPGSNYGQAKSAFLDKVPVVPENIHRIKGELPADQAAADYGIQLAAQSSVGFPWPVFDVILLGVGSDGHTASLFPGKRDPGEFQDPVIAVTADYEDRPSERITLTPMAINSALNVMFLVKGHMKASAVSAAINGPTNEIRWPVQRIKPIHGIILWLLDEGAAAGL
jgi:6-phosphogluconolactonase